MGFIRTGLDGAIKQKKKTTDKKFDFDLKLDKSCHEMS